MTRFELFQGDSLAVLPTLADSSVDSIVCDPPYGLSREPDMAEVLRHWLAGDDYTHTGGGFMGKAWDSFVPGPSVWRECLRVLKPGGHLLAFFGSRTYDMGTLAIRLAGFEIRDQIQWIYGSGFPKSLDVAKALGKAGEADASAEWQGWGTALKPAQEPIVVARKPLAGTVAANVLAHGTGALNIDGCRVFGERGSAVFGSSNATVSQDRKFNRSPDGAGFRSAAVESEDGMIGRWPANVIHDGSDEVVALFPANAGAAAPVRGTEQSKTGDSGIYNAYERVPGTFFGDKGSAARFFYCPKASKRDRGDGNGHPTVKPTDLMRYLCRLVTPPGGTVLDPFMGSGSTGKAAMLEGFRFVGIEREAEYVELARARIAAAAASSEQAPAPPADDQPPLPFPEVA